MWSTWKGQHSFYHRIVSQGFLLEFSGAVSKSGLLGVTILDFPKSFLQGSSPKKTLQLLGKRWSLCMKFSLHRYKILCVGKVETKSPNLYLYLLNYGLQT